MSVRGGVQLFERLAEGRVGDDAVVVDVQGREEGVVEVTASLGRALFVQLVRPGGEVEVLQESFGTESDLFVGLTEVDANAFPIAAELAEATSNLVLG